MDSLAGYNTSYSIGMKCLVMVHLPTFGVQEPYAYFLLAFVKLLLAFVVVGLVTIDSCIIVFLNTQSPIFAYLHSSKVCSVSY